MSNKYSAAACFPNLSFLCMLKDSGVGNKGINTTRSSYSSFVTILEYESCKHLLVCKYWFVSSTKIHSLQNIQLLGTWGVISYTDNKWADNLKDLSVRTATLLSIFCRQ